MRNLAVHVKIGILAGILFFLHALIPYSDAWPMIWQGIAAAVLVIWLMKSGKDVQYRKTAKRLFQTGLISSAIFVVCTAAVLFTLTFPSMNVFASFPGAEGEIVFNATLISGLLMASAIGVVVMLVIGSLTYLASPKNNEPLS